MPCQFNYKVVAVERKRTIAGVRRGVPLTLRGKLFSGFTDALR
jgi:hypothetical protein